MNSEVAVDSGELVMKNFVAETTHKINFSVRTAIGTYYATLKGTALELEII